MTNSTTDTPAPLSIGPQFNQVFKSLTAGDDGVSRAIADSGAGVLSTSSGGRTSSPAERATPTVAAPKAEEPTKVEESMDVDHEDNVDQLSDEAPTPSPELAPAPTLAPARALTPPPMQSIQPGPASPKPQPEVHRSAVQSVGKLHETNNRQRNLSAASWYSETGAHHPVPLPFPDKSSCMRPACRITNECVEERCLFWTIGSSWG
ncbi:hypothetical protein AG1IA_01914 [Rhizoctonia solani AG-1 IA]|uniref:Uncharacterized protein n=1 Tax=Thanatephorus cucumeris (strain AG1-IA) TaxID=983506 RepID=L8X1E8_THACA|nr:hypothetical protein AG1IA_01914 [Rhizoctonia solani AG-1 IA]